MLEGAQSARQPTAETRVNPILKLFSAERRRVAYHARRLQVEPVREAAALLAAVILTIERVPAGSPGRVIVLSEFIRRLCGRDLTARDVNSLLHLGGADREGNPASLESGILRDVAAAVRFASFNPGWAPAMGADLPRMTLVCPVESRLNRRPPTPRWSSLSCEQQCSTPIYIYIFIHIYIYIHKQ